MVREFYTSLPDGTELRWRPITWGEFRTLLNTFDENTGLANWLFYDAVASLCLIDFTTPEDCTDQDELYAGTIATLGEHIVLETGFQSTQEAVQKHLAEARERNNASYYNTGTGIICHVFHYRPEEVDDMDIYKFMDLLALAEKVVGAEITPSKPEDQQEAQPMITIPGPDGKPMRVPLNTKKTLTQENKFDF